MVLAAQRKRLAGRPSRDKVDSGAKRAKIQISHIALTKRPSRDGGMSGRLVFANRLTSVPVHIDNKFMLEPRAIDPHAEAAGSYEQFNRSQCLGRLPPGGDHLLPSRRCVRHLSLAVSAGD